MEAQKGGVARIPKYRRVQIDPSTWCGDCGQFASPLGMPPHHCDVPRYVSRNVMWNLREDRKWSGKPLKEYLPEHVSEADYYQAKTFVDAGFNVCVALETFLSSDLWRDGRFLGP